MEAGKDSELVADRERDFPLAPCDPHAEYRRCHLGGAVYLMVEAALWLLASCLGASGRIPAAMLTLMLGGMFIHPLATALSKLLKRPSPRGPDRLGVLITWLSLAIPLGLPLIFMATAEGRANAFFPAFAVLIGAHWLPFAYVYAMKSFLALAGVLVIGGTVFAFVFNASFSACGFFAGGILILFAAVHWLLVRRERKGEM